MIHVLFELNNLVEDLDIRPDPQLDMNFKNLQKKDGNDFNI